MNAITIHLPESVHGQARLLAETDETSIDNFIASAVSEKIAARRTAAWLKEQARRHGSREKLIEILNAVPDVPPAPPDTSAA